MALEHLLIFPYQYLIRTFFDEKLVFYMKRGLRVRIRIKIQQMFFTNLYRFNLCKDSAQINQNLI